MYINVAYPPDKNPNTQDLSVPLKINNCGHYRVHTTPQVKTIHPEGRNDYQLIYVSQGKGHFVLNGVETIVPKGNMVLYRPKEPQVYHYYATDKTEVYWVHFTGCDVEKFLTRYHIAENGNVFYCGASPDYPDIYNQMIKELQLKRAGHEDLLTLLFNHMLIFINRYIKEEQKAGSDMINEIERALHYFKQNFNKEISVQSYAKEHFMMPDWFIKSFKKIVKITPMKYILSLRISAAKEYLEKTNKNITEISNSVGYDNPLYFSRVFKKYTSLSPTEYKNLTRN